jgi:hypothetical protein
MTRVMTKKLKKGVIIFLGLTIFHLGISILMSWIAQTPHFRSYHESSGFWMFAGDSVAYHDEALRLLGFLKSGDYVEWWTSANWPHVRLISLSYAIFVPHPLAFALINALTWTASVIFVYNIVYQLFPDRRNLAVGSAFAFGLCPSYLAHTTQLLKDPFYVLGILMVIWGWISFLTNRRAIIFCLLVGFGVQVVNAIRPYMLESFVCLSFLALILVVWRSRSSWAHASLAFILVVGLYAYELIPLTKLLRQTGGQYEVSGQAESQLKRKTSTRWNIMSLLKDRFSQAAATRDSFSKYYHDSGSNIDTDVRFRNIGDLFSYIPRAIQVGFLSPFPGQWFDKAKTSGKGTRILAGLEMVCWYTLMVGFLYFLVTAAIPPQVRIWLFVYCVGLVLFITLVVPNIGALHRMRFVYFLPILIGGLEAWTRWLDQRLSGIGRQGPQD